MRQITTLSREQLHALVWSTPMVRLAKQFGLSGNGLAKICRRLEVPYPPRGWWAKKAAGHKVRKSELPPATPGTPSSARIVPSEAPDDSPAPDLSVLLERIGKLEIPERVAKAHPVIASWRAERRSRREEARRDPWLGGSYTPPDFTAMEKTCQRALHVLLKVLERHGATAAAGDRVGRAIITVDDEKIEIEIREKLKRVKRPMTDDEKRWRSDPDRLVTENVGTGKLHAVIHTWSDGRFRREWLESDSHPISTLLPEVAATVLAMGPYLAALRREREEQERLAAERRRDAEEERRRRRRDDNRWRRFTEFAQESETVRQARAFLEQLRQQTSTDQVIGDRTLAEWLAWAEHRAAQADPLVRGPAQLFEAIHEVSDWTYRD